MTERARAAAPKAAGAPDPLIGRLINERFKVSALIARGGMGKVYRAEQAPLGRVCAVKVLNPSYAGEHDPEFHKRFFLEASIASKLTHPNTVTIFDYGRTDDDIYYMAMEYLEGYTLHRAIRQAGSFPEERVAHIARQICRALREAHSLGVIHRDLKPANIFLVEHGDEADFVKVLDFGLVKNVSDTKTEELTQTGLFMGSPKYMAPEQIRGDRVDARTDIYALGIIMYEMLAGKVPFDRANSVNILMAHVNEEPPPIREMNPNVQMSATLEELVMRCMAKDADQRFRSMDELLAALKKVVAGPVTGTHSGSAVTGGTGEFDASGGRPVLSMQPGAGASGPQTASFLSTSGSQSAPVRTRGGDSLPVSAPSAPLKNGSKGVLVAAVLGGTALVAAIAFLATRDQISAPPSAASATPTPSALVASAASADLPPVASPDIAASVVSQGLAIVKVRLSTQPDGASVKEDGVEICNSTPCDVTYRGADADPNREHVLQFSKAGYRVETKLMKVNDASVPLKLAKLPPAWVAPAAPKVEKKDPPTVPGYKSDIPY